VRSPWRAGVRPQGMPRRYHAVVNLEAGTLAVAGQPGCKASHPASGGTRSFRDCLPREARHARSEL
jgi:hypothetical protein